MYTFPFTKANRIYSKDPRDAFSWLSDSIAWTIPPGARLKVQDPIWQKDS